MLSKLWVSFLGISFIFGVLTNRMDVVSAAYTEGAAAAIELILKIVGLMCLWSGVMEIAYESGLSRHIASLMRPLLKLLFGKASNDKKAMELISANITANMFGVSNAATPIGLQAASRLYDLSGKRGTPDSVLTLTILNTASIQIIPTTVAAIRASYGAAKPFDIMPAVWGASLCSVVTVLFLARLLKNRFPDISN